MTDVAPSKSPPRLWLVWAALMVAGALLLGDAFAVKHLARTTAQLGIALLFSAFALLVTNGKGVGITAALIVWAAAILCWCL